MYRLTQLSRVSLALTVFTFILVALFKNHLLVYTAVLFATANIGLFLWALFSTRGLTVERSHSQTCLRGYPLRVLLTISNRFRTHRFALVGYDQFTPAKKGDNLREVALLSLAARSSVAVEYEAVPSKRGRYTIGPFYFYSGDPFGFYRNIRKVNVFTDLVVLPTPLETQVSYLRSTSQVAKDELSTVGIPGSSTEFLGVREYQSGDQLRKVHWASTARLGKLITKQFERNVASTLCVLLVNDDRSAIGREAEHNPLEYSITLVSTLARETSRSHYYFSFLELNGRNESRSSGMGSDFFQSISLQLAEISSGEKLDLTNYSSDILGSLPAGSDLIVFIPHLTGTESRFLANLRLNYRLLSVITFDLESFRKGAPSKTPRSRVSFGQNFLIFELAYGDDLVKQLDTFVEKVRFIR